MKNDKESHAFASLVTEIQQEAIEAGQLDFRTATFSDTDEDRGADSENEDAILEDLGGYQVIQIPPDIMGIEAKKLWQRMQTNAMLGIPPQTPCEGLIRAVLSELRKRKAGKKIKVSAVFAGITLAIAKTHGVPMRTHERGVALHLGTRYSTLLAIRKVAVKLIEEKSIRLVMPDWVHGEWE